MRFMAPIGSVFGLALLTLWGCGDQGMSPDDTVGVSTVAAAKGAKGGAAACPTPSDVVVTDEAELFAALADAVPGDVIGVDGTIDLATGNAFVTTPEVTLTCVTPGSGLVVQPEMPFFDAVFIIAPDVAVSHLVIDAADALRGALRAVNNGTTRLAANVDISHNTVTCGRNCLFFSGVPDASITDNHFLSANGRSGVHLQGQGTRAPPPDRTSPRPIDGSRVLRNTIIATAPFSFLFPCAVLHGGIRVRDGKDVEVSHNVVSGPWTNSLSPADISDSSFEHNSLDGADCFGVGVGHNRLTDGARNNVFRNNRATGSGTSGVFVINRSCENVFIGNNLQGNFNDVGAIFTVESGANTMVGNNNVVFDDGDFDCDGDGSSDPNRISGRTQPGGFGPIVSEAASSTGGMN